MIDPEAPVPARILDESRSIRRIAVAAIQPDRAASVFALRSVLVRDEDAAIRALAAAKLRASKIEGDPRAARCSAAVEDALADALLDPSGIVREEAARSAGALSASRAEAALRSAAARDGSWRVRRAAVRALGRIAGDRAADALFDALDDPFWRVRYAAIQALAARPNAHPRREASSSREASARAYLAAVRRGDLIANGEPIDPALVHADEGAEAFALGDPDPAVVAARIASVPPGPEGAAKLVVALGSSHASLRRAAVRLLAARGAIEEIAAALAWLDDPRVLYASDAVKKLLRRVHTAPLVDRVLSDPSSGSGARAWALAEAARLRIGVPKAVLAEASRSPEIAVRRAAIWVHAERGDVEALIAKLADPDDTVRAEAVDMLGAALDDPAVRAALPSPEDSVFVARALLGAVRVAIGRALDPAADAWIDALLLRASATPWADVRAEAIALRSRRRSLPSDERRARLADPDPWIREASVDASAGATMLVADPDPFVRRAAAHVALAPDRALEELAGGDASPSSIGRRNAAAMAARSTDPWIRAMAASAIDGASDEGFASLLRLSRDRAPMVRAAAADGLERPGDLAGRCLRLVTSGAIDSDVRLAAHARLVAFPSSGSIDALAADLENDDLSRAERDVLRATASAYPEELRRARGLAILPDPAPKPPARAIAPRRAPDRVPTRPLGGTGIHVAPLAISGAGEMPIACYEAARDAGVNAFFWEPSHRALSTYLRRAPRRPDLAIVTGSYEADARSIERDVDRALRRLRVDSIAVMLLFWVRSSARLGDAAWGALDRLKNKGKVRAIGFSTHLRDLATQAIAARPWDVVMCRLSAAHPGAERALLPACAARGTGVIAFSALCYGRLVSAPIGARRADPTLVRASDCYRYVLSQPGVSMCLSAPRRFRELTENLAALRDPTLDPASIERLRAHGERVRADNLAFASLVHRAT